MTPTPTPNPGVTTTVSTGAPPTSGAPPAAPTPAPAAPPSSADELAAIKAELATMKGQVEEHKRAAEYWASKAGHKEEPKPAAPPAEDETDVLDLLTTKGAKGLDELLAKRGYVRKDEVEARVASKAAELQKEQELLQEYPYLAKKDSEFFKATALEYGGLVKAGTPQALAMELAAERVALNFMRAGKMKTPQQRSDEEKEAQAAERRARAAAQAGDRGGRVAPTDGDGDDELTAEQKRIAAAMGVSEDAYKARAKKGVAIRGGLR